MMLERGTYLVKNQVVALMPTLVDVRRHESIAWCADLLSDVDMWRGSCEVRVVQVGRCAQKEADSPIVVRMSLD
jgi:hypothetical protein